MFERRAVLSNPDTTKQSAEPGPVAPGEVAKWAPNLFGKNECRLLQRYYLLGLIPLQVDGKNMETTTVYWGYIWDNGKENGKHYLILGSYLG